MTIGNLEVVYPTLETIRRPSEIKRILSCDPQSPFTAFNVGRIENDQATLFSILLIWNLCVKKCAKKLGFTACRLRK